MAQAGHADAICQGACDLNTTAIRAAIIAATIALPGIAFAQETAEKEEKRVRVSLGAQVIPAFPGADGVRWNPMVDFEQAVGDETFGFEAPDDSFGLSVIKAGGFSIGPVIDLVGARTPERLGAAMPKVGTSVELGMFVQQEFGESFRLHGEVRQAVSGHDGLVATAGADVIMRDGDQWLFSIGPRVKWADGKYHDAWFSVTPTDSLATGLATYDAHSGIHSAGVVAGADMQLTPRWGIYAYGAYDRLVGDAGDSPVVTKLGSRDQLSAGVALSYTFRRR